MDDRFRLLNFGEGQRQFDTGVDLQNRGFEYGMSRDAISDALARSGGLSDLGYGARPDNTMLSYADILSGGSGAYGANAATTNAGVGSTAANLAYLLALQRAGGAGGQRGNLTQSGYGGAYA